MESFSLTVKATLQMYADCAAEASRSLTRNWIILPASVLLAASAFLAAALLGPLGMVGGFIVGLAWTALLSMYYSWLADASSRQKLSFADLPRVNYPLFMAIISVAFLLWIIEWIAGSLVQGLNASWIMACLRLGIVLVFNPLPETIYSHRYESSTAMRESYNFISKNWIEWYLPFVVLMAPWFIASPHRVPVLLSQTYPLLPSSVLVFGPAEWFSGIGTLSAVTIGIILANWFMLFRAQLFSALESGSRRQRAFKAKQR